MADLPDNASLWSVNSDIAGIQRQNIINAVFTIIIGIFAIFFCFKILTLVNFSNILLQIIVVAIASAILWERLLKNVKRNEILALVAIGTGHPWHPGESIDDTSVWVSDGTKWHEIPQKARLFAVGDPILARTLIKKDNMNGKIILYWNYPLNQNIRKVISHINQALTFRDAQERDDGFEDPIEDARIREDEEFYPTKRVWQDTSVSGAMSPQPGALLRKMRRAEIDSTRDITAGNLKEEEY
ncbi:MAG: hypothetical protein HOE69_06070 [Euryarchaeota archaeon]|nr:hypothetical protein [Euryarchaeota archaeon]